VDGRLPKAPFLYPIIDVARIAGSAVAETIALLGRSGLRLLQLRAKTLSDGELLAVAREAAAAAREAGALLIVNDRADVARLCGAAGVHVGQDDLRPAEARQVLAPGAIVGRSTHTLAQVQAALGEPIDYLAVGPVFATGSKVDPDPVVGLELVAEARRRTAGTLVAIGGISPENVAAVFSAGADGVALIGGLLAPEGMDVALERYRRAVPGLR
jgi:thiamine-phosphate pyrophosphorylase